MVVGIGNDIIEVARFVRPIDNDRFLRRCFTDKERDTVQSGGNRVARFAGRFAAKEAVVKAMGTGFLGFWPCEVEIGTEPNGRPSVRLHGKAAQLAAARGITQWEVSISHCRTHATAVALALAPSVPA